MLKHAPAHPPVIAATSGRPSGLHPIRLVEGHILGVLGGPRRLRDFGALSGSGRLVHMTDMLALWEIFISLEPDDLELAPHPMYLQDHTARRGLTRC